MPKLSVLYWFFLSGLTFCFFLLIYTHLHVNSELMVQYRIIKQRVAETEEPLGAL